MLNLKKILLFLLFISLAVQLPHALAGENKGPGKKWGDSKSRKEINTAGTKKSTSPLPAWIREEERKAWKNGRPPGWDRGKKAGWHGGNLPPGQAKKKAGPPEYAPRSWHRWTEQERHRYEERIGGAERKIRELIEKKGNLPAQMLDSATLSLFSAARQGVPVDTVSAVITRGIEQGLSPQGIESVTRALSYGVERQADFGELEKVIRDNMNRGLTDEDLTMEVYEALSR